MLPCTGRAGQVSSSCLVLAILSTFIKEASLTRVMSKYKEEKNKVKNTITVVIGKRKMFVLA